MAKDIFKKDLYAVIGVPEEATEKEILTGYRKRALKCHPDKNPDNPKAAEHFHELSQALEILTDPAARSAYDQSLKAKKVAAARTKVLDSKRKKFKEDLEARERAAFEQSQAAAEVVAEKRLRVEIDRLRKEGSKLLEQEQKRLIEEIKRSRIQLDHQTNSSKNTCTSDPPRIKLKWKAQKSDKTNGGYTCDNLKNILGCYGHINTLLISSSRNGSAVVEFDEVSTDILDEVGHSENPFTIVWLSGKPSENSTLRSAAPVNTNNPDHIKLFDSADSKSFPKFDSEHISVNFGAEQSSFGGESDRDFESLVLMRMRQAEERKKLMEQIMREDAE
ncbi:unnamed protein product [Lymnaea stagnalis]|uniref:DnaJ homolog subfamily C member 17 n=1 Tax=Lymnaea stagnalis TaxID=6523 RepID=A0AAV2I4M9_LYMST